MSRRRQRRDSHESEQLILPREPSLPEKPKGAPAVAPEQAAKTYITRRAKPSVVPGHVMLIFTLDMPREVAGRLSARASRDGLNVEAALLELLRRA